MTQQATYARVLGYLAVEKEKQWETQLLMHRVLCAVLAAAITTTHAFHASTASSFTGARSGEATPQVMSSHRGKEPVPRRRLVANSEILYPPGLL